MKPLFPKRRTRRLRARAATMDHQTEFEDYGPEPNMKLSHAFMVVLALHVIAVGGLYAFNKVKAGHVMSHPVAQTSSVEKRSSTEAISPATPDLSSEKVAESSLAETRVAAPVTATQSEPSRQPRPLTAVASPATSKPDSTAKVSGIAKALAWVSAEPAKLRETTSSTDTKSQVAAAAPAPAKSRSTNYQVVAGDTLTKIAATLGVAIPDLEKANGLVENTVLQVGQQLKVPEKFAASALDKVSSSAEGVAQGASKMVDGIKQAPAAVATAAASMTGAKGATAMASPTATVKSDGEYTVVKGDNPYSIAKRLHVSYDQLIKLNNITDPRKIQIGQKLKIPAKK